MELRQGFKQTEVGVIPNDWGLIKIENNVNLKARIGWQGLTTKEYLESGDYSLVTGTDFLNGYVNWDSCVFVDRIRYDQDRNIQLKVGDVIVTKDGTIGKVAFIDRIVYPTTLNSGVFVLRPKTNHVNNRFFYNILMSSYFDEFLNKITAGSTITHLYQKDFVHFSFVLPPILEQTAIATALSDIDELISQIEKLIDKKKAIKLGVMQELLKPKEGWVKKKFTDIVDYIHGKAHEQFIVYDGKFKVVNSKFISSNGEVVKYSNNSFLTAKKNDILTVLSDLPNGKALAKCFLVDRDNLYAVNQRVCIWRSKGADSIFLYYLLNRHKYFLQLDDGVTQTHILNGDINRFELTITEDLETQKEIGVILSDIDKEIVILQKNNEKLNYQKQGMMQTLLTGKIRLL